MERCDFHHLSFHLVLENYTLTWGKLSFKVHFERFSLKSAGGGVEILYTKFRLTKFLKTNKFASSRVAGLNSRAARDGITKNYREFGNPAIYLN